MGRYKKTPHFLFSGGDFFLPASGFPLDALFLFFPLYRTYVLSYNFLKKQIIFHVDVNNAYLSWKQVYRLKHLGGSVDLREQICAVGGDSSKRHGIILAIPFCKACGIQTGESLMEARQKCPGLLIVPPHYRLYSQCSNAFMEILREYTPDVEQYSIDEAFMDMSGTGQLWGNPISTADAIRERIERELGFTVNIGISENKLLAKMASDFRKPNRTHTLFPEEIPRKCGPSGYRSFFVGAPPFPSCAGWESPPSATWPIWIVSFCGRI